mmetsp:Transcript_36873/g.78239  ORF Transcript_36873/g.78239 Transcript_36873/m.78239 type:complete len:201 (+) Transcript_36873:452-1054(+)
MQVPAAYESSLLLDRRSGCRGLGGDAQGRRRRTSARAPGPAEQSHRIQAVPKFVESCRRERGALGTSGKSSAGRGLECHHAWRRFCFGGRRICLCGLRTEGQARVLRGRHGAISCVPQRSLLGFVPVPLLSRAGSYCHTNLLQFGPLWHLCFDCWHLHSLLGHSLPWALVGKVLPVVHLARGIRRRPLHRQVRGGVQDAC